MTDIPTADAIVGRALQRVKESKPATSAGKIIPAATTADDPTFTR
jgi:hypothetical protein